MTASVTAGHTPLETFLTHADVGDEYVTHTPGTDAQYEKIVTDVVYLTSHAARDAAVKTITVLRVTTGADAENPDTGIASTGEFGTYRLTYPPEGGVSCLYYSSQEVGTSLSQRSHGTLDLMDVHHRAVHTMKKLADFSPTMNENEHIVSTRIRNARLIADIGNRYLHGNKKKRE